MLLEEWLVNILVKEIAVFVSPLAFSTSLKLFLNFLLHFIIHDEVSGTSQHQKLGCSFFISVNSVVLFLEIGGRFDDATEKL